METTSTKLISKTNPKQLRKLRRASEETTRQCSKLRKEKGKLLHLFGTAYLSHYHKQKTPRFHDEIKSDLLKYKKIARAAPREHAKSTIVSLEYTLWNICYNKKKFIVLISDTYSQAADLLSAIKDEFEENEKLQMDFPEVYPLPNIKQSGAIFVNGKIRWTEGMILTGNKVKVVCKGTGSKVRGLRKKENRPDLVILDDCENDELVATPEQRKKLDNWFRRALLPCLDSDKGQLVAIGTILHYDSLLSKLLSKKEYTNFNKKIYKAINNNKSLWEDRWPIQKLMEKKSEVGTYAFQSEYMNEPIDDETSIFKREWIDNNFYSSAPKEPMDIIMAIDPAISQKETADYFAICVLGRITNGEYAGDIFVLDIFQDRLIISKQVDKIVEFARRWNPRTIRVETVAYQEALKQLLDNQKQKGIYLPTKEFKPNKDKIRRAIAISPYVEKGNIKFNKNHTELYDELVRFPMATHDDTVDAFVSALEELTSFTNMKFEEELEGKGTVMGDIMNKTF